VGKCEPKINPSTEKSSAAATTTEKSKAFATTVEKLLTSVSNASEKCMSFNLPNLDDVNDSVTFTAGNLLVGDGTEWVDLALGTATQLLRVNAGGTGIEWATVSGTGDITGPGVAVIDNAITRWDGTSGLAIQGYTSDAPTISDTGDLTMSGTITGVESIVIDNITINGNTISSAGASTLAINPTAGQSITFDSTVTLDAGVIAGATSITSTAFVGDLTGNADTVTTNANLTGEVTSIGNAATLDVTAISGQALVTAVATDMLLIEDAMLRLMKHLFPIPTKQTISVVMRFTGKICMLQAILLITMTQMVVTRNLGWGLRMLRSFVFELCMM
jgi:hypothetical protein